LSLGNRSLVGPNRAVEICPQFFDPDALGLGGFDEYVHSFPDVVPIFQDERGRAGEGEICWVSVEAT
jgi:hypothetical protein